MNAPAFSPDGFYVALETSGRAGTVAVAKGSEVLGRGSLRRQGAHAALLIPAVVTALAEAGVDIEELTGVVVGEGPGSFTGVRVAGATAKGIAHARRIPMWAVSSLAAAALSAPGAAGPALRYVLFDARGDRVYGACYGVGKIGLETLIPPHAGNLREVLASDVPAGAVFVGEGAERHRAAIEGAGFEVEGPPVGRPDADGLLRYLGLHPDTEPVASVESWEPRYVRASNAERAWQG